MNPRRWDCEVQYGCVNGMVWPREMCRMQATAGVAAWPCRPSMSALSLTRYLCGPAMCSLQRDELQPETHLHPSHAQPRIVLLRRTLQVLQ